jgi:signal transduction histidine kinase
MAKRGQGARVRLVSEVGSWALSECMSRLAVKTRLRLAPLLMLILLPLASSTNAAAADKKALFLYGDRSNGMMVGYREALVSAIKAGSPDRITFYEEYMDLSQYSGEEYLLLLRNFYREKYRGQKFDLIITQAGSALGFLTKYGEELFPDTPVVFGILEKSRLEGLRLGPNITGVLVDVHFDATLAAALRIQPDVRNVVVVSGTSEIDAKNLIKAKTQFRPFEGRVEFTYLTGLPINQLEERLANLPERTIVFYVSIYRDGAGQVFTLLDSMARVAKASNLPTYSVIDRLIEAGSIGGFVFSIEADAKEVAKVALRVLAGEKPADIPIRVGDTNRYMFDWRQLRRWQIEERNLPPGSILLYRVPSFWEAYKWRIVAISVLCILEALLIMWLLINRKRIRRSQQAVQQLSGRLLMLRDEEQQRVAAELHDGLGQNLAIIKNRAMIGLRDETNDGRAREQLQEIAATANASIVEVREIAHNLRPYELDRLGLVSAIESMIERVSESAAIKLSAKLEPIDGLLSPEAETSVYRIVQEGLNNVLKHSKATETRIEFKKIGKQLLITLADNGVGISASPKSQNGTSGGFGLVGIAERVRVLGGSFTIDSPRSRGTTIKVTLDLANGSTR